MMPGSLSIVKKSTRWSRAVSDAYLTSLAVGLLAGLVVTYARTPLHMPGHKVLFWMIPVLACRFLTRARAGASTAALGTVITVLLLDGQLGGGYIMMPLVVVAGFTLDLAVAFVQRRALSLGFALPLLALAGLAANLICFIKRLFDPGQFSGSGTLRELFLAAGSYALFGLLAGIIGGLCGWSVPKILARQSITPALPGPTAPDSR